VTTEQELKLFGFGLGLCFAADAGGASAIEAAIETPRTLLAAIRTTPMHGRTVASLSYRANRSDSPYLLGVLPT
jgi:hypothetical protein